jgi:hypothetical protein
LLSGISRAPARTTCRIFKTSAYATELTLFVEGMRRAREGLMILTFMLGLYLCVFGTLLYMAEHDSQQLCKMPEVAQFSYKGSSCPAVVGFTSIPTGWYFILATLTTVGYGDMYPITITGKMLTGFCMACGIMVLGLPIVVISNSFDDAFKDAARNAALREAKAEDKKFQARVQKNAIDVTGKVGGVRVSRARVGSKNQSAAEYFNLGSGDPSIDVLITIRSLMLILDDLYMHSGDQRFDSARRALTRGACATAERCCSSKNLLPSFLPSFPSSFLPFFLPSLLPSLLDLLPTALARRLAGCFRLL